VNRAPTYVTAAHLRLDRAAAGRWEDNCPEDSRWQVSLLYAHKAEWARETKSPEKRAALRFTAF